MTLSRAALLAATLTSSCAPKDAKLEHLSEIDAACVEFAMRDVERPTRSIRRAMEHACLAGIVQIDKDRDGYAEDIDCDDDDWSVNPGASEEVSGCNGIDDDCDGLIDEHEEMWDVLVDADGDRYGTGEIIQRSICLDMDGYTRLSFYRDCDDSDPRVRPFGNGEYGFEALDGKDNDCDGEVDHTYSAWVPEVEGLSSGGITAIFSEIDKGLWGDALRLTLLKSAESYKRIFKQLDGQYYFPYSVETTVGARPDWYSSSLVSESAFYDLENSDVVRHVIIPNLWRSPELQSVVADWAAPYVSEHIEALPLDTSFVIGALEYAADYLESYDRADEESYYRWLESKEAWVERDEYNRSCPRQLGLPDGWVSLRNSRCSSLFYLTDREASQVRYNPYRPIGAWVHRRVLESNVSDNDVNASAASVRRLIEELEIEG